MSRAPADDLFSALPDFKILRKEAPNFFVTLHLTREQGQALLAFMKACHGLEIEVVKNG